MHAHGARHQPRDRRDDRRAHPYDHSKPPVLRRAVIRWLCLAWIAAVVYGTIGPIGLGRGGWIDASLPWSWSLQYGHTDYNDLFTNTLVYVPVGVALRLLLRRRGLAGWPDFIGGVALAWGVSYGTELVQQLIPARSSSLTDVWVNSLAAGFGCAIAPAVQALTRTLHLWAYRLWRAHPWTFVARVSVTVAVLLMTVPFQPGAPHFSTELLRRPDWVDVRRVAVFALAAFFLTAGRYERTRDLTRSVIQTLLRVAFLGLGLEILQAFLVAHTASMLDAISCVFGAMIGTWSAARLIETDMLFVVDDTPSRSWNERMALMAERFRPIGGMLLLLAIPCAALPQITGLTPVAAQMQDMSVRWLPFQAHFYAPFHVAVADVMESLLLYGLIAVLCRYLSPRRGAGMGFVLLAGLVCFIELCQDILRGSPADVTPLLLAIVAWVLAGRVWGAMKPHVMIELTPRASVAQAGQNEPHRAPAAARV